MSKRDFLAPPPPPRRERRKWTRPEDYLPQRRRRARSLRPDLAGRPEAASVSRPMLGIVPFMLLMLTMGVLTVAIMITAYPGQQHPARSPNVVREEGTAPPGWLKG